MQVLSGRAAGLWPTQLRSGHQNILQRCRRPLLRQRTSLFSLSALSQHFQSLPASATDHQTSGFSKLCAQSVHDYPAAVLPSIPADFISQWVADSADFSHFVNGDIEGSGLKWSVQQFCNSTISAGHLLIDLFGVPSAQCSAIMLHYKLLKANNPTLSAHIVAPSVKHTYNAGFLKPAGMMMQTVQQFKRGRRRAVVVYNPPVLQRRDAVACPVCWSFISCPSVSCRYPCQSIGGYWRRSFFYGQQFCQEIWFQHPGYCSTSFHSASQWTTTPNHRSCFLTHAFSWFYWAVQSIGS